MLCGKVFQDEQRLRAIQKAEGRISKELDVINFIKAQKYLKIIMRTLFTKFERHLISHNRDLILKKRYPRGAQSSSSNTEEDPGKNIRSGPHTSWLLK